MTELPRRAPLALRTVAVASAIAAVARLAAADAKPEPWKTLLGKIGPSIVTVKVVLKMETTMGGQSRDQESRQTLQGVVVDPSGLIMTSNTSLSADRYKELMGSFGGNTGEQGFDFKITPTDVKVIFERESEEHPASIVARDTILDLAFIQVDDISDRKLAAISFDSETACDIGDEILLVSRLERSYDYAPYFERGHIAGIVQKPREAWLVDAWFSGLGLPVFSQSGQVVGAYVTLSAGGRDADDSGFGDMMMMFGQGSRGGLPIQPFVVPSGAVKGVIGQAKKQAADLAAKKSSAPQEPDGPAKD
ncbi:MAG: serine protease [Acidobacteriota bacterium]